MESSRYRSLAADHAPDAVFVVDDSGAIVYANPSVSKLMGYSAGALEGRSYLELVHPEERAQSSEVFRALLSGEAPSTESRQRLVTADGSAIVCGVHASRVALDGESFVVAVSRDLESVMGLERELADAKAFLERLIEVSPMVVFRREGPDLRLTYVSPNASRILNVSETALLGSPMEAAYERAHPDDRQRMRNQVERALGGESVEITYRFRAAADDMRWVVSTLRPDPAQPDSRTILGYIFDITSQRKIEAELEWLAMHDPLTGLANRAKFESDSHIHLALSARKDWNTALFYIDLDEFKTINDTYGHDAGDRVLETLARRIENTVRDGDLTARLGGDEFVVLLPDVGDDAAPIAERLHGALTAPVEVEGTEVRVGASIGIAFFPRDADDLDALRRRADDTMYVAKQAGDAYRFWHDLDEEASA